MKTFTQQLNLKKQHLPIGAGRIFLFFATLFFSLDAMAANNLLKAETLMPDVSSDQNIISLKNRTNEPGGVTLASFTADCKGSVVWVKWITVSETNNKLFFLEESADVVHWTTVRTVQGVENSVKNRNYAEMITPVFSTGSYFRLTQIDKYGNQVSYDPVKVNCQKSLDNELLIAPNPAKDFVNITFDISTDLDTKVTIFSTSGKVLFSHDIQLAQGENIINLDITSLPSGSYFVKVTNDKKLDISGERVFNKG